MDSFDLFDAVLGQDSTSYNADDKENQFSMASLGEATLAVDTNLKPKKTTFGLLDYSEEAVARVAQTLSNKKQLDAKRDRSKATKPRAGTGLHGRVEGEEVHGIQCDGSHFTQEEKDAGKVCYAFYTAKRKSDCLKNLRLNHLAKLDLGIKVLPYTKAKMVEKMKTCTKIHLVTDFPVSARRAGLGGTKKAKKTKKSKKSVEVEDTSDEEE